MEQRCRRGCFVTGPGNGTDAGGSIGGGGGASIIQRHLSATGSFAANAVNGRVDRGLRADPVSFSDIYFPLNVD